MIPLEFGVCSRNVFTGQRSTICIMVISVLNRPCLKMDLLHRCSGTSFCHYTKRVQRACLSFMARYDLSLMVHYDLLPKGIRELEVIGESGNKGIFPNFALKRTKGLLRTHFHVPGGKFQVIARFCHVQLPGRLLMESPVLTVPVAVSNYLSSLSLDVCDSLSQIRFQEESKCELVALAKYYFEGGGKLFRPTTVLLMAGACSPCVGENCYILPSQYKMAVVCEMLHTASLVHDDVIDEADLRRNRPTMSALSGNRKVALVVGVVRFLTDKNLLLRQS